MRAQSIILGWLICGIAAPSCTASAGEATDPASKVSADWIYFRQLEVYIYLLRFAEVPQKERLFFQKKAYEFFFTYWVLHRSSYAQLQPVPDFEQRFALLLRNHAVPFLDANDPLDIKSEYKNGKFVPRPLPKVEGLKLVVPKSERLPHVQGLPSEKLECWATYQEYVRQFRHFIDSSVKKRLEAVKHAVPSLQSPKSSRLPAIPHKR